MTITKYITQQCRQRGIHLRQLVHSVTSNIFARFLSHFCVFTRFALSSGSSSPNWTKLSLRFIDITAFLSSSVPVTSFSQGRLPLWLHTVSLDRIVLSARTNKSKVWLCMKETGESNEVSWNYTVLWLLCPGSKSSFTRPPGSSGQNGLFVRQFVRLFLSVRRHVRNTFGGPHLLTV